MADIILRNRTKNPPRMLVFNLTKMIAPVRVATRTYDESKDGVRRARDDEKTVAGSLRIAAGGTERVDDSVARAPEIAAAIARRDLVVEAVPEPVASAPVASSETQEESAPEGAGDESEATQQPRRRRG